MTFGLFIKGNAENLIIDDTNPVLAQAERGAIMVTTIPAFQSLTGYYGTCMVAYKTPRTTQFPPLVFGIPSGSIRGGIGFFAHIGGPGNWTGFRIIYTPTLRYDKSATPSVGIPTGWEYRVCDFHLPPNEDRYGMRVWSDEGRLVFDSGWTIASFRGLLRNWSHVGSFKTGRSSYMYYWANREYNPNKKTDGTYSLFSHPWDANNYQRGVMISQLGAMTFFGDDGYRDQVEMVSAPMVGFIDDNRSVLSASLHFGILQHAGSSLPAMNNFALMTADFSS